MAMDNCEDSYSMSAMSSNSCSVGYGAMAAPAQMAMASNDSDMDDMYARLAALTDGPTPVKQSQNRLDFREIVNGFKSNGLMTDKMQAYVTVTSAKEVISKQSGDFKLMTLENDLTDDIIWTLVAIKTLNEYYAEKLTLWALVEKKARKYV